jgi:hypothetical protein
MFFRLRAMALLMLKRRFALLAIYRKLLIAAR